MADEQKPKKTKKEKAAEPTGEEAVLTTTAKAIGKAAGKIAALAGVEPPAEKPNTPKTYRVPKLEKKNKSRLPRRQKKAQQKLAAAQNAR
jgi:hypothetical protein